MVRINIINPKFLADQHLIAEFNEILMLLGYIRKHSEKNQISKKYILGKGHIIFFKNKLEYLRKRHESIRKEMLLRGFSPKKRIVLDMDNSVDHSNFFENYPDRKFCTNCGMINRISYSFNKNLINDWKPNSKDKIIIKKRIIKKINLKKNYYRYCKEKKSTKFLINLIKKS